MQVADSSSVLLVGASGRVGKMVHHHWPKNSNLHLVPHFRKESSNVDCIVWDPLEPLASFVEDSAKFGGFSTMIILAGVTSSTKGDLRLNKEIAEAWLEVASRTGIKRVLLASSSAVYGVGTERPLVETDSCNPANEYGVAKLEMERVSSAWRAKGVELCIMRIGNVAGADALLLNVEDAGEGMPIEIDIFSDRIGPVRSYIGAQTLASVLHTLCKYDSLLPEILNIGTPHPVSMNALADAARHPWYARRSNVNIPQRIILNCGLVSSIHRFQESDSWPDEMVRQWKEANK